MTGGYHSARDQPGDLELSCDVVVVGSGAGGAVVAAELAESGQRVVVLEEGPNVSAAEHARMRPTESMRHIWRDGAFMVAMGLGNTPAVNVTMGRCVGGSSVLTGGVCFRVPELILDEWTRALELPGYRPKEMEPYFARVEEAIHVEVVPDEMRSRSAHLFVEGAGKRGFVMKPMHRNTRGCRGCGQCNFGCPHGAKLSVDVTYLPRAVAKGTDVFSHCLVEKVLTRGSRAVGVTGRVLSAPGGRPGGRLTVHARRVVIAAGGWHTPGLLRKSGYRNRNVGRNLTLHPGFRMLARFDDSVRGWQGALQSVWTDAFEHDHMTLTGLWIPVGMLAATMPGVGVEHTQSASHIHQLAMMGGIVHDQGGGTIHRGLGREPFVTYKMMKEDRARVPKLIHIMAEAFFAAGAREVFPPILGCGGVDADGLRRIPFEKIPGRRLESASQHPLGSCQMGVDPKRGAVDPDGRVWDMDELWVADGSIVPTSLGVNPQLSIMSIATRVAHTMRDEPLPS